MRFNYSGKNIELTKGIKDMTEDRFKKIAKYFNEDAIVNIRFSKAKKRDVVEVSIPFSGTVIRAEEEAENLYDAIDESVEILERQIQKHKTRLQKRKHSGETIRFENIPMDTSEEDELQKVVRTKKFFMKPMDIEEAILQMELLRHNFFVFKNTETDTINVLYQRKDGQYGLIEPEM